MYIISFINYYYLVRMLRIVVGVPRYIARAAGPRSTAKLQFSVCLARPYFTSRYSFRGNRFRNEILKDPGVRFLRARYTEMYSAHVARECRLLGNLFDSLRVSYAYAILE